MERRLAAILAADVVGYSRLMEADEAGTLAALKSRRKAVFDPLVARHHGRIVKLMGDGVIVEFASAVSAVQCAVDLQNAMATANADIPADRQILLRVGVNLGDVMVENGDLYGDSVNIASRLEAFAESGGICISGKVHDEIGSKLDLRLDDLGERPLRNIARPVRVYRILPEEAGATPAEALPAASRPSVAVLPFSNMSGDPAQQYFSDGISEDIITELARWREFAVLSRNSSFQHGDKAVDVKRLGRELGVQYILEGSVRKIGSRIRITAQLIDTLTGNHVWAEHYDRALNEIFEVQDDVVKTIVSTLVGRVQAAGAEVAKRKPPTSLAAYECVLFGRALPWGDPQSDAETCRMYEKAIELDPGYALPHALLALMLVHDWDTDIGDSDGRLSRALALAKRAVELDENDSMCHLALGRLHLFRRSFDLAEEYHRRALQMNPTNPEHIADMGVMLMYFGRLDEAIDWLRRAKLADSYFDPTWYWHRLGIAHLIGRRYDEAIASFERSRTRPFWVHAYIAACHAQMGRAASAKQSAAEVLRLKPGFTAALARREPFKNPADLEHLLEGLRKAGLADAPPASPRLPHIVVVDDEAGIRESIVEYLEPLGFRVSEAADGAALQRIVAEGEPVDLALLDVHLAGEDGLVLARWLRQRAQLGVIMVTGAGDTGARISGLEAGADDYIVKPFDLKKLLARVRSVLRRVAAMQVQPVQPV